MVRLFARSSAGPPGRRSFSSRWSRCAAISLGATGGWLAARGATEPGSSAFALLAMRAGRSSAFFRLAPFSLSAPRFDDAAFGIRDAGRRPLVAGSPLWTGRDIPPGRYRVWLDSGLNVTGALTIALGKPGRVAPAVHFAEHRPGATDCDRRSASRRNLAVDDARLGAAIVSRGASSSADLARHRGNVRTQSRPRRRDACRRHVCEKGSVFAEPPGCG